MQYKGHDKELVLITFKHLCFVLFVAKTRDGEHICFVFLTQEPHTTTYVTTETFENKQV